MAVDDVVVVVVSRWLIGSRHRYLRQEPEQRQSGVNSRERFSKRTQVVSHSFLKLLL